LGLAQAQARFQLPVQALDCPTLLVEAHDLGWCPWIACIKEQRSDAERSLVELGVKVAWHAMAQQGFHDPRLVRHTCRHSWAIQPLIGMRLRASNYLRPGRTSREAISALPTPGPQTTIP
jgi:hypothetical protein